jgi:hypothetical protein
MKIESNVIQVSRIVLEYVVHKGLAQDALRPLLLHQVDDAHAFVQRDLSLQVLSERVLRLSEACQTRVRDNKNVGMLCTANAQLYFNKEPNRDKNLLFREVKPKRGTIRGKNPVSN